MSIRKTKFYFKIFFNKKNNFFFKIFIDKIGVMLGLRLVFVLRAALGL